MKVWIQAWTAKVPASIEIDLDDLRKIEALKDLEPLIPVMVKVQDKHKFVNTHLTDAPKLTLNELEQLQESLEPWRD
jgi:hypothetical protein